MITNIITKTDKISLAAAVLSAVAVVLFGGADSIFKSIAVGCLIGFVLSAGSVIVGFGLEAMADRRNRRKQQREDKAKGATQ